jgi:hypothetical protein
MIRKREKRGSHVEIIISFIIFVTFVVFLLTMLIPTVTTKKDKENAFEGIQMQILDKVSSNMTLVTVNLDSGDDCVDLTNILNDVGIGNNIIVKDNSGTTVEAYSDGDSLEIDSSSSSDTFFKIYYSEEFNQLEASSGCTEEGYTLGLTKIEKYVFENKVIDLIAQGHESLEDEFKIPESIEFGFGIVLSNGTLMATQDANVSTSVYVQDTPIEYVDTEGNIVEGYIRTKVW